MDIDKIREQGFRDWWKTVQGNRNWTVTERLSVLYGWNAAFEAISKYLDKEAVE